MSFINKQTSKINGSKQNIVAKHGNHMAALYILHSSVSFTGVPFKKLKGTHRERLTMLSLVYFALVCAFVLVFRFTYNLPTVCTNSTKSLS